MLTGRPLILALLAIAILFAVLVSTSGLFIRDLRKRGWGSKRERTTALALACASLALLLILLLHATWSSANLSQRLGAGAVRFLAGGIFCFSVAGLLLSLVGVGKRRLVSGSACLLTGAWWLILAMGAAISMASPLTRHPVKYLIPAGYTGWVRIRYKIQGQPPLAKSANSLVCRIPISGELATSSEIEDGWASDAYAYYFPNGPEQRLAETEPGNDGLIWGQATVTTRNTGYADTQVFFVGTETQFQAAGPSEDFHPVAGHD